MAKLTWHRACIDFVAPRLKHCKVFRCKPEITLCIEVAKAHISLRVVKHERRGPTPEDTETAPYSE